MSVQRKQLHLMVSLQGSGYYPGSWRHSSALPNMLHNPVYYYQLAQTAERGKLDLIYLDNNDIDPLTLMSAIFANTNHIGIGAPVTTELIQPYAAARSLAAIDHFSKGRAAWYAAMNNVDEPQLYKNSSSEWTSEEQLERNHEFVQVTEKLWDSWDADALLVDREQGKYIDSTKVHRIHHEGKYYQVQGPLSIPRPPQGRPIRIGFAEPDGADILVTSRTSLDVAIARRSGLQPAKVLTTVVPILADTEEQALALAAELRQFRPATVEFDEDHLFIGTPDQLADWMELWFTAGGSDGFNVQPALLPVGLNAFVDKVIPLLQQKGLFRTTYTASTLRTNLGLGTDTSSSEEVTQ